MTDETTTGALPDLDALQRLAEAVLEAVSAYVQHLPRLETHEGRREDEQHLEAVRVAREALGDALRASDILAWIAATRALVAERDSAQDACLEWDTLHRKQRDRADSAEAHAAALVAEVARLKAALENYGEHFDYCPVRWERDSERPCSCGLDAALTPTPPQPAARTEEG